MIHATITMALKNRALRCQRFERFERLERFDRIEILISAVIRSQSFHHFAPIRIRRQNTFERAQARKVCLARIVQYMRRIFAFGQVAHCV